MLLYFLCCISSDFSYSLRCLPSMWLGQYFEVCGSLLDAQKCVKQMLLNSALHDYMSECVKDTAIVVVILIQQVIPNIYLKSQKISLNGGGI